MYVPKIHHLLWHNPLGLDPQESHLHSFSSSRRRRRRRRRRKRSNRKS
jgi:hypothetical protein